MSTRTGRQHRCPAMRGRTTPTHHPTPPRTAWTLRRATSQGPVRPLLLSALRGPGRTRRGSQAASMPTRDTTHRVMGTRTRPNAPSALGPISRARAPVPLHPRDTTWTRTGPRPRRPAMRGRTTPTHHPTPPRTAWTPPRGATPGRVHRVRRNAHRGPGRTRRGRTVA